MSVPLSTNPPTVRRSIFIIAVVFIAFNLLGLTRSPLLWVDEATLNDAAREWVMNGHVRSSVFSDVPEFARGYYWQPPLQTLVTACSYSVFGFGIWQTRIPPLLFAGASLVVLGMILGRFRSPTIVIVLTSAVLAADPLFSFLSRSGRMDSMCIFFLLVAIHSSLKALDTSRPSWSVATGFAIGAAGMSHPIAAGMGAGIVLAHAMFVPMRRKHLPLLIMSGMALPVVWVSTAWFSGEWAAFAGQFLRHGSDHLASSSLWERFVDEVARYPRDFARAPFAPALYLAVVILFSGSVVKRRRIDHMMIMIWFVSAFVFNVLFMTKDVGFYVLYPVVIAVIMLGLLLADVERAGGTVVRMTTRYVVVAIVTVMFAVGPGGRLIAAITQWQARDPEVLRGFLENVIPRGSRVFGDGLLWYAAEGLGYDFRIDDYYLDKAYPERRARQVAVAEYIVLEKKQVVRANLDGCSLVDSITVTGPSLGSSVSVDTVYSLFVLRSHGTRAR